MLRVTRKRIYKAFGDISAPLSPKLSQSDHVIKSFDVEVSTSDISVSPAVYSLEIEILPSPLKFRSVGMVTS